MQLKLKEKKTAIWNRVNQAVSILPWRSGSGRGCTLSQRAEFQGLAEMSAGPWTFSGYDILRDESGLKVTGVGICAKNCTRHFFFFFFVNNLLCRSLYRSTLNHIVHIESAVKKSVEEGKQHKGFLSRDKT